MHGDIKPDNVLLFKNNAIKLCDFGNSKVCKSNTGVFDAIGTPFYMAPEVCRGKEHGYNTDLWSFGVMIYELYYGKHPFLTGVENDTSQFIDRLENGRLEHIDIHDHAFDFFSLLMMRNPEERLSATEAYKHPFLWT